MDSAKTNSRQRFSDNSGTNRCFSDNPTTSHQRPVFNPLDYFPDSFNLEATNDHLASEGLLPRNHKLEGAA